MVKLPRDLRDRLGREHGKWGQRFPDVLRHVLEDYNRLLEQERERETAGVE